MSKRVVEDPGLWKFVLGIIIVAAVLYLLVVFFMPAPTTDNSECKGTAECLKGEITSIVDGDTLYIGDTKIRLALVDTPEFGEDGYWDAKNFTANLCPVGSQAIADQDDIQLQDSYGRMIAVIYCDNKNLNKELLENGHAVILTQHCIESEFGSETWARDYGC